MFLCLLCNMFLTVNMYPSCMTHSISTIIKISIVDILLPGPTLYEAVMLGLPPATAAGQNGFDLRTRPGAQTV